MEIGTNLPVQLLSPEQAAGYVPRGSWLRFVAQDDLHQLAAAEALKAAGFTLLLVLTKASFLQASATYWGEVYGGLIDAVQVINEPDAAPGSESSDVMSQAELFDYLAAARAAFTRLGIPVLGPGLCSGNPSWWNTALNGLVDGLCLHPYAETPESIGAFLARYRLWGKPLYVTEFGRQNDPAFMAAMFDALGREADVPVACVFWPSPAAVAGHVGGQGPMATFQLGFKDYAAQHPEVGVPVEDEQPLAAGYQSQMTSTGLLVYSKQANVVQFHPAGKA